MHFSPNSHCVCNIQAKWRSLIFYITIYTPQVSIKIWTLIGQAPYRFPGLTSHREKCGCRSSNWVKTAPASRVFIYEPQESVISLKINELSHTFLDQSDTPEIVVHATGTTMPILGSKIIQLQWKSYMLVRTLHLLHMCYCCQLITLAQIPMWLDSYHLLI